MIACEAMIAWDARVFFRAALLAALGLFIAWVITAASDEGGIGWGIRAGRSLPVAPLCGAVGTALALLPARARDEFRTLESLGRTPFWNGSAAASGGGLVPLAAALLVALVPAISVEGFFPALGRGDAHYRYEGGAFVDETRGIRVEADGSFAPLAQAAAQAPIDPLPEGARASSALVMAVAGVALPLVCAGTLARRRRASAAVLAVSLMAGASIVLFHLASARTVPSLVAVVPASALLLWGVLRYREPP